MASETVQGKRDAAMRWANDSKSPYVWRYLLLSETDIEEARGSWPALRRTGS